MYNTVRLDELNTARVSCVCVSVLLVVDNKKKTLWPQVNVRREKRNSPGSVERSWRDRASWRCTSNQRCRHRFSSVGGPGSWPERPQTPKILFLHGFRPLYFVGIRTTQFLINFLKKKTRKKWHWNCWCTYLFPRTLCYTQMLKLPTKKHKVV